MKPTNYIGEVGVSDNPMNYLLMNYHSIVTGFDVKENSIKRYLYDAEAFISFIGDNGFGEDVIKRYKAFLKKTINHTTSTNKNKLAIAKRLCKRLFDKGITNELYGVGVKNFRVSSGHKKDGLNQNEIDKIENYFSALPETMKIEVKRGKQEKFLRNISTNKTRDYLMFCLMAYQGLRTFEVCGIEIQDINLNTRKIFITGKSRDDGEWFDLQTKAEQAIRKYLSLKGFKSGWLIPNRSGNQLSTSTVRYIFNDKRKVNKENRGADKGIFPSLLINKTVHGLRHYFISSLLDKFNDIPVVMAFARLRTLETVKVYDDRKKIEKNLPDFRSMFGCENPMLIN